jgi:copper transport protein
VAVSKASLKSLKRRQGRRRWARAVGASMLAALLAVATLVVTSGVATGHAILLRTDPPDGVVLAQPPTEVHLWFSEAVLLSYSSFELADDDGHVLDVSGLKAAGDTGTEIVLKLPALGTDTFRLNWRTVSADDLHAASGSLVFGVAGGPAGPASQAAQAVPWSEIALGWAGFAALAGFIGSLVVAFLVLPSGPDGLPGGGPTGSATRVLATRLRRRLLRTALASAVAGLLVALLSILAKAAELDVAGLAGAWTTVLLSTDHGLRTLGMAGLMLVGLIVLLALLRHDRPAAGRLERAVPLGLVAIAGLVAVLRAENSHAASIAELGPLPILASALHSLAVGLWMGGVAALALTTVPMLTGEPAAAGLARHVLRRFGVFAASGLAIVVVSGLVLGSGLVASIDALVFSPYGQLLIAKVVLASLVGLIALANAASLHPRVARAVVRVPSRRLRRLVPLEAAGGLAIIAIAASLAATPPPQGPEWAPAPTDQAAVETVTGQADDLLVTFQVRPNRPGRNFVSVRVYDTRRPAPAPIEQVRVDLKPPAVNGVQGQAISTIVAARGTSNYEAAIDLPAAGSGWQVSVTAIRTDLPDASVSGPWSVLPELAPIRTQAVVISNQPLRPIGLGLAAILALLFTVGLLVAWARVTRRPRFRSPARPSLRGRSEDRNGYLGPQEPTRSI